MSVCSNLFLSLVTVAAGQQLFAEYSAFSGLGSWFRIGTLQDSVPLAIDFARPGSFLYLPGICPAIVEPCIDPAQSESFVPLSTDVVRDEDLGWTSELTGSDTLFEGDAMLGEFPFQVVVGSGPQTPQFRDVAGVVSFARSSPLMTDKSIMLLSAYDESTMTTTGVSIELVSNDAHLDNSVHVPLVEADAWAFDGHLSLLGVEMDAVRFHYRPEVRSLRLPLSWQPLLVAAVGDSLTVPCESAVSAVLTVADGLEIEIPSIQMLNATEGTCSLLVKFHHFNYAIIGSQLTDSVNGLVLDNEREIIAIQLWRDVSTAPHVVRAWVPVFRSMVVYTREDYIRVKYERSPDTEGLILAFHDPVPVGDAERGDAGLMYWFVRTSPGSARVSLLSWSLHASTSRLCGWFCCFR